MWTKADPTQPIPVPGAVGRLSNTERALCRLAAPLAGMSGSALSAAVEGSQPRVMLIGEAPGPSTRSDAPLFPYPVTSAGGRLLAMSGMRMLDYLQVHHRANLLAHYPGARWPTGEARAAALTLVLASQALGWTIVALGNRVAEACGMTGLASHQFVWLLDLSPSREPLWSDRPVTGGIRAVRVPHPSGRSRLLNDPAERERVRATLAAARG